MNYIKHLTGFFDKVAKDRDLNPTHVSLYMALFQFWNCNRFKNPISISRDEVMRISKISSKATYHKCLKNLHYLGYIKYEPSYNPFKGSHAYLLNLSDEMKPLPKNGKNTSPKNEPVFGLVTEQVLNKSCTGSETGTEQALVSYINNTNIPNISNNLKIVNLDEQAKKIENDNGSLKNVGTEMPFAFADTDKNQTESGRQKKEKSSAKKEKDEIENSDWSSQSCHLEGVISSAVERQETKKLQLTIEKVKAYFLEQNFPELEAIKFFNYFSSNGWLVGGKTPMVDWQAAAQNWILNAPNFKHNTDTTPIDRAKHLNTGTDKDYSEPL